MAVKESRLLEMRKQIQAAGRSYDEYEGYVLEGDAYPFLKEFAELMDWDPPTFEQKFIRNWFEKYPMQNLQMDPMLTKYEMKQCHWQVFVKAGPYECFGKPVYLPSNFLVSSF